MKKRNILSILIGLMGLTIGTKTLLTNHINQKTQHNQHNSVIKTKSIVNNKITLPSNNKTLDSTNLVAIPDFTNIATIIRNIILNAYFGYPWNLQPDHTTDTDFVLLFKVMYQHAQSPNEIGNLASVSEMVSRFDVYEQQKPGISSKLLTESFGPNWSTLNPLSNNDWRSVLVSTSSFYWNLENNYDSLQTDCHSIHDIVSNNYFGYALSEYHPNDYIYETVFKHKNGNLTVKTPEQIFHNILKYELVKNFTYNTIKDYILKNPGVPTDNINDLSNEALISSLNDQNTELENDAFNLSSLVNDYYLGYNLKNPDSANNPLFPIIFGSDKSYPTTQDYLTILKKLKNLKAGAFNLLKQSFQVPGAKAINLIPGCWLQTELANQTNSFTLDTNTIYTIITNNYFGYAWGVISNIWFKNYFQTGSNPSNPQNNAQSAELFRINLLAYYNSPNRMSLYALMDSVLKNPGTTISSPSLDDLNVGSSLQIDLARQNNDLNYDINTIYSIAINNYYGYVWGSRDMWFNNIFNPGSSEHDPNLKLVSFNQFRINVLRFSISSNDFTIYYQYISGILKNPGSDISSPTLNDLKVGTPLQIAFQNQVNKLFIDVTSLFSITSSHYFGYSFTNNTDPLFNVLFGNNISTPTIQTKEVILNNLKTKKINTFAFLQSYLTNPGIATKSINDLVANSWLQTELNYQTTTLTSSLTNSITNFYNPFLEAFTGKNFNAQSFIGAEYVLLFFNIDKDGNLSLGTSPALIAKTFVNNLIVKLTQNPNFQFPSSTNNQLNIMTWINSLYANDNGQVILTSDLATFAKYEAS